MNTQDERKALEAEVEQFKIEAMKMHVVECWASTYRTDPFSYFIDENKVVWMNAQARQLWDFWKVAKDYEAKKLEGCVVVPEAEFALLPKTIIPEIEEILGMPCFKFIKAAQIYRQLGFDIPPKAEKEQSFFMFKFLHLALVHGDKCFDVFESETKAMVEAARGGK